MTERERLIELIEAGTRIAYDRSLEDVKRIVKENHHFNSATDRTVSVSEMVADFLLENGVVVPPVKMGDIVYIDNAPHNVVHITIEEDGISYCAKYDCDEYECCKECPFAKEISFGEVIMCEGNEYHEFTASDIGKTVFLTREEAEKALAEKDSE